MNQASEKSISNLSILETRSSGEKSTLCNSLTWHVDSRQKELSDTLQSLDWSNLESIPKSQLIKENTQRQVWKMELSGKVYYAKIYFSRNVVSRIKRYFRGPVCVKEWDVSEYARDKGIDCVRSVAYAISNDVSFGLDSILITEGLTHAVPLTDYWLNLSPLARNGNDSHIQQLEDSLAELLARAHLAGLSHSDLHPGNLLVEPGDSGRPRVFLVDLHSVRVGKIVSDREAIQNLAQLNQWFRQNATLTQRMRLLKRYMYYRKKLGYSDRRKWSTRTFKYWAHALNRAANRHTRKILASKDRRTMKNSKYFSVFAMPDHWKGNVFLRTKHPVDYASASCMEFSVEGWKKALENPEKMLEDMCHQIRPIKNSRTSLVCRGILSVDGQSIPIVAKRFTRRKPLGVIWDCLRDSRSLRAWKLSFAMLHRGLPVALPLAVLERRIGPYLSSNIFITQEVKPSVNLRIFITSILPVISPEQRPIIKKHLIDQLSRLIRKMHASGFSHRDMKATNILIYNMTNEYSSDIDPKSLKVILIDLDGLKMKSKPSKKEELRALLRLSLSADLTSYITLSDRARFLKAYLTNYGSGKPNWKSLWRDIQSERERKLPEHIPG